MTAVEPSADGAADRQAGTPVADAVRPLPVVRSAVGGLLMGLAMLVPGISGGTMIVVMGLFDEFIESLADVTRFRLTRHNVAFLAIVGGSAVVAIVSLAGTLGWAVRFHRSAMYSIFIGMTLGGTPVLIRMLNRRVAAAPVGVCVGFGLMLAIALAEGGHPDKGERETASDVLVVVPNYGRDVTAGLLGMSAMVLPGVSGAYMLLILGRYETILTSISLAKRYLLSGGGEGDPAVFLRVIIPTAIGAAVSLVCLSNVLKWMLHRFRDATVGVLLGIVFGSVVGIWPFTDASGAREVLLGIALALTGFMTTFLLSRIKA